MKIIEATTEATHEPSKRYRCRHLFIDGHRCGSPSLRGEHFCYYHHTSRGFADERRSRRDWEEFELPQLEDRSSILAAITEVLQRIACDKLPSKQAGLLLYGLQIASLNLPDTGEVSSEEDRPEEVIINPRYGDLAPVAEFVDQQGAPRPALGDVGEAPLASPQSSDPEPAIAPDETSNASGQPASAEQPATPQTQVQIKTPQTPRLFISHGIHKPGFYKQSTLKPAKSTILPNLNASADSQRPKPGAPCPAFGTWVYDHHERKSKQSSQNIVILRAAEDLLCLRPAKPCSPRKNAHTPLPHRKFAASPALIEH